MSTIDNTVPTPVSTPVPTSESTPVPTPESTPVATPESTPVPMPVPTLCLNMIVKNESKIITRLLDSVIGLVDAYCICDTGSTDNTVEIIETYFQRRNVPGKIVHEPFKNFCFNRNVALQSAVGLADFVLLLDADMVLEVKHFHKSMLCFADNFHLLQGHEQFYYNNMRIIRNDGLYRYVGVTHEYIDIPSNSVTINIPKDYLFIRDIGDGGSKSNKFERDIQLLSDGLQEEPDNVRYHFYLGNTYHDLGRYEEAIECYRKRITMGGWFEEVWYSYYRLGMCLKHLDRIGDAFATWLEGYDFWPERLEGLYEIIKHYRHHSKHKLCKLYYDVAKPFLDKPTVRDNYLFLRNDVYTHQMHFEYTIFALYVGVRQINDEVVQVLNHCPEQYIIDNLLSNMKFYNNRLLPVMVHTFDEKTTFDVQDESVSFVSSSSCLVAVPGGGYHLNVRYVNYHIEDNGSYTNCEKHIITVNKYLELDANLKPCAEKWLEMAFDGRQYIGVEDVRIYRDRYTDTTRFIGSGFHQNNQIGVVSGHYDTESTQLKPIELKQFFRHTGCEKNWVFVDYNGSTHIVYDWCPLILCQLVDHPLISLLNVVAYKPMPKIFARMRGSTCGFRYGVADEIEIWFVSHIVSYECPRHYYHVISVFDEQMNLLRYSAPFKFEDQPIEYCLSIVVEDERVLINYSTWDRTTRIGVYDKAYVNSLLKYRP